MISMMELMEEKTPLTKNTDKKKGMTLVEVMAAMAILSILFAAISGLMINTVKIEDRSNVLLDNSSIIKAIMLVFETDSDIGNDSENINNERFNQLKPINDGDIKTTIINFDTIEGMQDQLINGTISLVGKYKAEISIEKLRGKKLYKISTTLTNTLKQQSIEKEIIINRQ